MPTHEPSYFYKYRPLHGEESRIFTKEILEKGSLYFPSPLSFNDPFDCRPGFDVRAGVAERRAYLMRGQKQMGTYPSRRDRRRAVSDMIRENARRNLSKDLSETHSDMMRDTGILCLSDKADDILMWSHYAQDHTGVCFEFDASAPLFSSAQRVEYAENRIVVDPIVDDAKVYALKVLLTKSNQWSYEHEWRIIDGENGPGTRRFPRYALKGIILGARINLEDEIEVNKWVVAYPSSIEIKKAVVDQRKYKINFHSI